MGLKTDISTGRHDPVGSTDSYKDNLETDVLIVGAGFGGIYLMHKLRQKGFKCKIYEAGKDLGGIWYWNCYPGARVDSQVPVYEYSFPEIWKSWTWSTRYPGWEELRKYFEHVEKKLEIKKDVAFETTVTGAQFDKPSGRWVIGTEDGRTARARYLLLATGFAAKRHFPDWKGVNDYKGIIHHSSFWPEKGVDVKGKRVAVIGTGSTGIQLAQDTAQQGAKVTVFQRTPNLCLPMQQMPLTREEQEEVKAKYPSLYEYRRTTFAGFLYDFVQKNTFDDTEEEREAFYEKMYKNGGFEFWLANYKDLLYDKKANRVAYDFWAKKARARITDPRKRDILAPLEPPHAFGTKRPSLEQNFYEMMDKPENDVVDVKATPIKEFTETGITTEDGKHREFDVIALATGFDSVTGGMKNMGLRNVDGVPLSELWKTGTWSYLGTKPPGTKWMRLSWRKEDVLFACMSCAGFPNMFFLYGAQGPTAFSNGPTCVECQGDWIVDAITQLKEDDITYCDATTEATEIWRQKVTELSDKTLFPGTSSWYMGANVPGKPREQLNYTGGLPLYEKECREALDKGFQGFVTA